MTFAKDKGRDVRWVVWTTEAPHAVVIPGLSGKYLATGHTGKSLPPVSGDATGLSVTLSAAAAVSRPGASQALE